MTPTSKTAKATQTSKKTRPLGNQDYRLYFCNVRYFADTAFKILDARSNRAEQTELLKTLARLLREKTVELEEKERFERALE